MNAMITSERVGVRVAYDELTAFAAAAFASLGLPRSRAEAAAEALCYGDLTGLNSHGLVNLKRLYLPLLHSGRADPAAEPQIVSDTGAMVLLDARRALGLWVAGEAMELAIDRAGQHGIGLVCVRDATHFGCCGQHAARAARRQMIGLVASNCGRQRIARPPGGQRAMLGTNPLAFAAPAGTHPPYVLDMSTTVVPTGRIRAAARAGQRVPAGWLEDDEGRSVTDPGAYDNGTAHLLWLGGRPETGAYKGYGLALLVELLAGLVPGSGLGPAPEALAGDGRPSGRDDDIGFTALAIAPGKVRPVQEFLADADMMFGTLLDCPAADPSRPVRYPGWHEAMLASARRQDGVPLPPELFDELRELAARLEIAGPAPLAGRS
jgi:LDH2 family malate/lactate/ureidoglycolate dehydrogenase